MTWLLRDPADWARQWGWVSRLRAERAANRLLALAEIMRDGLDADEVAEVWCQEAEAVAAYLLAPQKNRERVT